ncbi:MAG: PIG-L family deacetylase [Bacteroidota bacterium]|nr:PIG-L family deacetylase [Bacteroidota bacterium]
MNRLKTIFLILLFFWLPSLAQHIPTLMDLSAHPDDEDGATLAYYRYKYGVRTYSVFFTRGEGGQNEIGPELYAGLGVLRTAETERAANILGSRAYFLNFVDFGFSKTSEETFEHWNEDSVVARLVYIIRKLKPDVIFTNHNTTDGHGNHQVVAIAAAKAFTLASDSTFHPEQLHEPGVELFQPKKYFERIFFGNSKAPELKNASIDVINPVASDTLPLGKTAAELAAEALAQHRTQGMDKIVASGRFRWFMDSTRYHLVLSSGKFENDRSDFFGGLSFETEAHLPLFPDTTYLTAELSDSVVVRKEKFTVKISSVQPIENLTITLHLPEHWQSKEIGKGNSSSDGFPNSRVYEITVPSDARCTYPEVRHLYESFRTTPFITADASFMVDGEQRRESVPIFVQVAPLQTISVPVENLWLRNESRQIHYVVKNYFTSKSAGRVRVIVPAGWAALDGEFVTPNQDGSFSGTVTVIPPLNVAEGEYPVTLCIDGDTAVCTLHEFSATVARGANIGVIQSYDNVFDEALKELEVPHRLLDANMLSSGDLQKFTSIIVDIRAYLVRPDLVENNKRLLEYVKSGGTLIVMYQKDKEWKPDYAPYPFSISHDRVTYETAPVTVLDPKNPIFNTPNATDSTAWLGWVQERTLYMPRDVPHQYEKLLSCSDPGESPLNTGLLYAEYGKGIYVYTSYVWYRELKEANKGAFQFFANMISLGAGK